MTDVNTSEIGLQLVKNSSRVRFLTRSPAVRSKTQENCLGSRKRLISSIMHSLFEGDSSRFASHGRESVELLNIDRASFPRRVVQTRDANRYRISNSLSPLNRYNRFRRIPRCDLIPFPTAFGEEVTTRDVSRRNNRALAIDVNRRVTV